jgi:serine phosphatase RsbU (regulator of sigma subunit)
MMGVGGDFISMRYLPDRNLLGLFLCDVSGHGVPAAFTATMVSMGLDFVWESRMDHPAEVLKSLRNLLMGKMAGSFFTAAICVIDLKKKVLVSCNAGHPPVIHIRKKGKAAFIHSKGRLINELFEPEFEEAVTPLKSGDRLLIYTDGITEAEDSTGRMLGGEDSDFIHWADSLSGTATDPENLCSDIIEALLAHTEGKSIDDDVALIAVEIK